MGDFLHENIVWHDYGMVMSCTIVMYNLGQNNCRLFHVLAQLTFNPSERELVYYHEKVNVRVASWVSERFKTWDLGKLRNFKKSLKRLEFNVEYSAGHAKGKLW